MVSRYRALVVHAAENAHREDVARVLMQLGFTVTVVDDFATAKQTVTTDPPDLLITDVRLGAYNGLHLVVVGKAALAGLAAIVIGGPKDAALRGDAERVGAVFLSGDVEHDVLVETVGMLLRRPVYAGGPERRGPDRRRTDDISLAERIEGERRRFARRRQDRLSRDQHRPDDSLDLASDSPGRKR